MPVANKSPIKSVHVTDLQTYCTCRRKWYYSSPLRRGLQPAVTPSPLMLGQGIHVGLNYGYKGCACLPNSGASTPMRFDLDAALDAYRRWLTYRVEKVVEYTGPLWDSERREVVRIGDLGQTMLQHYSLWASKLDERYVLLDTERTFTVPLFWPRLIKKRLTYDGRVDGLVKDTLDGNIYILEFKTARSLSDRDLSGTLRSIQASAYTWATNEEFRLLGGTQNYVKGMMYRFLLKKEPNGPEPLPSGGFSTKMSQHSTKEWVAHCLKDMAKEIANRQNVPHREKQILKALAESAENLLLMYSERDIRDPVTGVVTGNEFFVQKILSKTALQVQNARDALILLGREMADPNTSILPVPGYHCSWCHFKAPCDLEEYGQKGAAESLLSAEYAPRDYWEDWEGDE